MKSRVHLSDFVRSQVKLKKRGHDHIGLCPFHKEKTPSFHVHDQQGMYKCFGCGASGDVFSYVQETKNLPFMEALEFVANQIGLSVPKLTPPKPEAVESQKSLLQALHEASLWYHEQLLLTHGEAAQNYLKNRGVKGQTIQQFRLGFARPGLGKHLKDKGFSEDILIHAGLLTTGDYGAPYDRFRDRLMFPIFNRKGQVIAFGGRILGEGEPKYLNSPETELFQKRRELYGLNFAIETRHFIVVEGYMDVISLHQAGIKSAVAPLGTALTEDQMALMWRYCPQPIVCFDGDNAGSKAAYKSAHKALEHLKPGYSLKFTFLPQGEDPDSLIQKTGVSQMKTLFKGAIPLVDVLWQELLETYPHENPDDRAKLDQQTRLLAKTIKDPSLNHYYAQEFRQRLKTLFKTLDFKRLQPGIVLKKPKSFQQKLLGEKILLATLLNHPKLIIEQYEAIMACQFSDPRLDGVRQSILDCACHMDQFVNNALDLKPVVHANGQELIDDICCEKVYVQAPFARSSAPLDDAREGWLHVWKRLFENVRFAHQISEVVAQADSTVDETLWNQLKHLKAATLNPL